MGQNDPVTSTVPPFLSIFSYERYVYFLGETDWRKQIRKQNRIRLWKEPYKQSWAIYWNRKTIGKEFVCFSNLMFTDPPTHKWLKIWEQDTKQRRWKHFFVKGPKWIFCVSEFISTSPFDQSKPTKKHSKQNLDILSLNYSRAGRRRNVRKTTWTWLVPEPAPKNIARSKGAMTLWQRTPTVCAEGKRKHKQNKPHLNTSWCKTTGNTYTLLNWWCNRWPHFDAQENFHAQHLYDCEIFACFCQHRFQPFLWM